MESQKRKRQRQSHSTMVIVPDAIRQTMFDQLAAQHFTAKQRKSEPEPEDVVGLELEVTPRLKDPDDAERALLRRPDLQARMEELEGKHSRAVNDHFDPVLFEQHLRERGILRDNWIIHQRRAQMDPFYALWYCPTATVTTFDPTTQQESRVLFIDKVVRDCMDFFERRGGDAIAKNKQIQIAFDHLRVTTDSRIKLFAICFFMTWAPEIRDFLAELYTDQGFRKRADFLRVAKVVGELCEVVWRASSVSRYNINQVVNDVLRAGTSAYIRPPAYMNQHTKKKK